MLGYESQAVNDQLINVAPGQAYAPTTFGSAFTGPGFWPRNGVFNVPPVVPSAAMQENSAPTQTGISPGAAGTSSLPTTESEKGNAFHLKKSPLVWALGMFVIGVLMLQHIHYK